MTKLACKYCSKVFTSLIVIPEHAVEDVTKGFVEHLKAHHREEFDSIAPSVKELATLSIWLITVSIHSKTLDETDDKALNEDFVFQQFEKQMAHALEILGIEDDDDEDEDEDGDDETSDAEDDTEDVDQLIPEELLKK